MRLRYFPIFCILTTLLMLTGCASTPQHLTEQNISGIKNIAVVSLVPEEVNFDKIGIISVSNKYTEFDLGNKVTETIAYVARERIAKVHPGWNIKEVKFDRAAMLASVKSGYGYSSSRVQNVFAKLARDNDLDAIFAVRAAADPKGSSPQEAGGYELREGSTVLIKDNSLSDDPRIVLRANLNVAILGKSGEVLAAGTMPAKFDNLEPLKPGDFDISNDMQHNHRPEILRKLGREVIADISRRLNYCFDSLGFVGDSDAAEYHVEVAPQAAIESDSKETSTSQRVPVAYPFDQCFSRCRQYTDRTKEQCFDVCNK
ncbi:MAG: hypothetical protein WA632_10790 [Gallionella sp.]